MGPDFPIVSSFQKRQDTDKEGNIHITQNTSDTFGMNAYLTILEQGKDNSNGLKRVAETVCKKMNEYAAKKSNNCNPVNYRGDLTEGIHEQQRNLLITILLLKMWSSFPEITMLKKSMRILLHLILI